MGSAPGFFPKSEQAMLHTLYSGAFPWVFLGYAPLLGEIFQLQPKACCAYDHEPSCNTQPLKDPLLWRVSLTEDSSYLRVQFFLLRVAKIASSRKKLLHESP